MRKIAFCAAIVASQFALISLAHAGKSELEKATQQFLKTHPTTTFRSITETDMPGLYEVVAGKNILYYHPETGNLIFGDIFDKSGADITQKKREELGLSPTDAGGGDKVEPAAVEAQLKIDVASLPLDEAITIGNGPIQVVEFTDPDCPFSRQLFGYLNTKKELTRHIFLTPLAHPAAVEKTAAVLAAPDKAKALKAVFADSAAALPAAGITERTLAQVHINIASGAGVNSTPTVVIEGETVVGTDITAIERVIERHRAQEKGGSK